MGLGPVIGVAFGTDVGADFGTDFGTDLLVSVCGSDMLMVVVDRFTKAAHLVPTTKHLDAEWCAQLLIHAVVRLHGLPTDTVIDRGKVFTSHFFVELQRLPETRQHMSTASHPQTDGRSQRANRVLHEVRRHGTSLGQEDWDVELPCVELA